MYGNHPYGTLSKRDIHSGTKLHWAPRLTAGTFPVKTTRKGRRK